jgi:hypothetical protein
VLRYLVSLRRLCSKTHQRESHSNNSDRLPLDDVIGPNVYFGAIHQAARPLLNRLVRITGAVAIDRCLIFPSA